MTGGYLPSPSATSSSVLLWLLVDESLTFLLLLGELWLRRFLDAGKGLAAGTGLLFIDKRSFWPSDSLTFFLNMKGRVAVKIF